MYTQDRTGTVPNRTGPDQLLFTWYHLEPIQVFTWDRSGTSWERIQTDLKTADPVLDPFGSVWIRLDPFRIGSRNYPV